MVVCSSARPYARHARTLGTPVRSARPYARHAHTLGTPVRSARPYARRARTLGTPIRSARPYARHAHTLGTPIRSARPYARHARTSDLEATRGQPRDVRCRSSAAGVFRLFVREALLAYRLGDWRGPYRAEQRGISVIQVDRLANLYHTFLHSHRSVPKRRGWQAVRMTCGKAKRFEVQRPYAPRVARPTRERSSERGHRRQAKNNAYATLRSNCLLGRDEG
jgi:hypothetical protein